MMPPRWCRRRRRRNKRIEAQSFVDNQIHICAGRVTADGVGGNGRSLSYIQHIWRVENAEWTRLRLWRMDNGDFRVTEAGAYAPILVNALYTLIDKRYAPVLEALSDELVVKPAKIVDCLAKTENDDCVELKIFKDVNSGSINTRNSTGKKVWTYNGHLFVSDELKKDFSRLDDQAITFPLGFSMFGA